MIFIQSSHRGSWLWVPALARNARSAGMTIGVSILPWRNACALPARLGSRGRSHATRPADRAPAARFPPSRLSAGDRMTIATVGAAKITRIEETYGFFFEAKQFFADWRDEIVAEHMSW